MTKEQARKILGISQSTNLKAAQEIYLQKVRRLRIRIMPGNLCSDRLKAQTELAQLATAWEVLTVQPAPKQTVNRKSPCAATPDLAGLWEDLLDILPIPKPVAVILFVSMVLTVVISLVETFMKWL